MGPPLPPKTQVSTRFRGRGGAVAQKPQGVDAEYEAARDAAALGPAPSNGRARKEVMHMRNKGFRLTVEWDGRSLKIALEPY